MLFLTVALTLFL